MYRDTGQYTRADVIWLLQRISFLADRIAGRMQMTEKGGQRNVKDEAAVAKAVSAAGFDPYEKKVLGITAMTSLMGRKKFDEVLGSLVERPQGKPTLVPQSDKRPELSSAADDFKE